LKFYVLYELYIGYGVKRHFQQYFSNIVVVSFIGEGNQSTRLKSRSWYGTGTNVWRN